MDSGIKTKKEVYRYSTGEIDMTTTTATDIQEALELLSSPEKRDFLPYFFKTGKGQYGEGDKFLGVTVPDTRKVAKANLNLSDTELKKLLRNPYHECRLCALLILVERYKKADKEEKEAIYNFYLSQSKFVNNWDLVDLSSRFIVGEYLLDKEDRTKLYQLAESEYMWDQRIAVTSTYAFIKARDYKDIIALSEKLMHHKHDLMHKAIGWMLREMGKMDIQPLYDFLDKHHKHMPRTMLRYSIEKLEPEERAHYMKK